VAVRAQHIVALPSLLRTLRGYDCDLHSHLNFAGRKKKSGGRRSNAGRPRNIVFAEGAPEERVAGKCLEGGSCMLLSHATCVATE
jgi:hypothetical protein